MRNALAENLPENREDWSPDHSLFHLTGLLLDFYRKAEKPGWWAIFSRMEMNEQELIDDPECIGGMTLCRPPEMDKRSLVYTYTFTAAHIILALLSHGKKIGVSSNSHKAINNLLSGIETYAHTQGVTFTGIKKCSHASKDSCLDGSIIADVFSNEEAMDDAVDLVGGTAWLFADPRNDRLINTLCRGYYAGISDCCTPGADLPVQVSKLSVCRTEAGDIMNSRL